MDVKLPVFKGRGGGDLSNEYFHYNRAIIHVERERDESQSENMAPTHLEGFLFYG